MTFPTNLVIKNDSWVFGAQTEKSTASIHKQIQNSNQMHDLKTKAKTYKNIKSKEKKPCEQ